MVATVIPVELTVAARPAMAEWRNAGFAGFS
jgi:hypothetical protein